MTASIPSLLLYLVAAICLAAAFCSLHLYIAGKRIYLKPLLIMSIGLFSYITVVTKLLLLPSWLAYTSYFLIISLVSGRFRKPSLNIFYGIFPYFTFQIFWDFFLSFVTPLFSLNEGKLLQELNLLALLSLLILACIFIFIKILGYNFAKLNDHLTPHMEKVITGSNACMIVYFLWQEVNLHFHIYPWETNDRNRIFGALFMVLFLVFLTILDRDIRADLQEQILRQKQKEVQTLADYSRELEGLYRDIRKFRHDYANIISSLQVGIDQQNLPLINQVYQEVIKDSNQALQSKRFDIGRLANIDDAAVTGIFYAKISQARSQGISVEVEIPQLIRDFNMSTLDLVTIFSILADNAIEACLLAEKPQMTISFLEDGDQQVLILQNSTREEQVHTSNLFRYGTSSKGVNRGIGLAKVLEILEAYPDSHISTRSQDYTFEQMIIF